MPRKLDDFKTTGFSSSLQWRRDSLFCLAPREELRGSEGVTAWGPLLIP